MEWLRWHHGAVADDKWPLVARRSGQSVAVVVAVWASLLECASQADDRGSIDEFDPESMDALLQIEDGATQAVLDALSSGKKPRIADRRIVNWGKRQPQREREDSTSTERSRKRRESQKALQENTPDTQDTNATPVQHQATPCTASETPSSVNETLGNANETPGQHQETPRTEQRRTEKKREEKSIKLAPSPTGLRAESGTLVCDKTLAKDRTAREEPPPREDLTGYYLPVKSPGMTEVAYLKAENWKTWTDIYGEEFCVACLKAAYAWELSNPAQVKTVAGIHTFFNKWLQNQQNRPGGARASPPGGSPGCAPVKNLDDLLREKGITA
jgi:hypothetical protein